MRDNNSKRLRRIEKSSIMGMIAERIKLMKGIHRDNLNIKVKDISI